MSTNTFKNELISQKDLLFSIYTQKDGHQIIGCPPFDSKGVSAFDQAVAYALQTYNDPNDQPRVFLLTEIPINAKLPQLPKIERAEVIAYSAAGRASVVNPNAFPLQVLFQVEQSDTAKEQCEKWLTDNGYVKHNNGLSKNNGWIKITEVV